MTYINPGIFTLSNMEPYFQDSVADPTTPPVVTLSTDGLAVGSGAVATTGARAIAIGKSYASGQASFACQIEDSTSTYGAQGTGAIAIGLQAKATSTDSVAIAKGSVATGSGAVAFMGSTASGTNSFSVGFQATATNTNSMAIGRFAKASRYGEVAFAAGQISAAGDSQTSIFNLRNTTADATVTELFCDGTSAANRITLDNNSLMFFDIRIVGKASGSGNAAAYTITGAISRDGNAASTNLPVAITKTVVFEDNAAWDVTAEADTTNGALIIKVTGAAETTIHWQATVLATYQVF